MAEGRDLIAAWEAVTDAIERGIAGLTEAQLDLRGGPDDWSIRETVHHLVEANLVAATMVIAALGASGCSYDWSWLNPDRSWMERTGYTDAPVRPALDALRSLCGHVAYLLRRAGDSLAREVRLLDSPGAALHARTVGEILRDEAEHVAGHVRDLDTIRELHGL